MRTSYVCGYNQIMSVNVVGIYNIGGILYSYRKDVNCQYLVKPQESGNVGRHVGLLLII